jgi:hypothetical protein
MIDGRVWFLLIVWCIVGVIWDRDTILNWTYITKQQKQETSVRHQARSNVVESTAELPPIRGII